MYPASYQSGSNQQDHLQQRERGPSKQQSSHPHQTSAQFQILDNFISGQSKTSLQQPRQQFSTFQIEKNSLSARPSKIEVTSSQQQQYQQSSTINTPQQFISFQNYVQQPQQSIQPAQQQQQQQLSQQCPSHPKYEITNICVSQECIEPLCPECVKIHTKVHHSKQSIPNIDTIECVRDQCLELIGELNYNFQREYSLLARMNDRDQMNDIFNECYATLSKSRESILRSVNSFFNQFEHQLTQRIASMRHDNLEKFTAIESRIQQLLVESEDIHTKLQSQNYVFSDDFGVEINHIKQQVDEGLQGYYSSLFNINASSTLVQELEDLLTQSIQSVDIEFDPMMWRKDEIEKTSDTNSREQSHKPLWSDQHSRQDNLSQAPTVQQGFISQQINTVKHAEAPENNYTQVKRTIDALPQRNDPSGVNKNTLQSKNVRNVQQEEILQQEDFNEEGTEERMESEQSTGGILISTFDYYTPECPSNIVHFFQDNSKSFHFLDLSQISADPRSQEWKTVELSISFKIPLFHRSIITPNGKVFLVGGVDVRQRNKSIGSTYLLDMNRNTLELCGNMNIPRSEHSLVFSQDSIFVVGGINNSEDDIYLTSCERFDIESQRWVPIADLQEGVSGTTLCNFDDRFIYRFGGKTYMNQQSSTIERYCIEQDFWEILPFQYLDVIPCFAGACQVNESEMIIFGGQIEQANQRQTLVARIEAGPESDLISFSQAKSLPISGTFWQNPIVGGNVIFAVQNIKMENSIMNHFNKKAMLIFNSATWKQIGSK